MLSRTLYSRGESRNVAFYYFHECPVNNFPTASGMILECVWSEAFPLSVSNLDMMLNDFTGRTGVFGQKDSSNSAVWSKSVLSCWMLATLGNSLA